MVDRLHQNEQLSIGQQLVASNGKTRLVMQGDGNLVIYRMDSGRALWASNTWRKPVTRAVMQSDGNFVCYDVGGTPHWHTGTYRSPGAYLILQDDGNLVVYDSRGQAVWASNTVQNWGFAKYHFQVKTADEAGAGTDSNIFVILYGEYGQTTEVRLNGWISGNAFERNRTDTFDMNLEDVGAVYKIRIRSDMAYAGAAWRLSTVKVTPVEPPQPSATFPYEDWITDLEPRYITASNWGIQYQGAIHSKVTSRAIAAFDLLDTDQNVQHEYTMAYTLSDQVQLSSGVKETAQLSTETKWESPEEVLGVKVAKLTADIKAMWQTEIDSKRVDTATRQLVVSDKKTVTFPARKLTLIMVEWTEAHTATLGRLGSTTLGLKWLDDVPSPAGWTLKSLSVGDEIDDPFASWLEANRPDLLAKLHRPLQENYCHYLVRPADTWRRIAKRLLGDPSLAGQIRLANPRMTKLVAGKRVAVPWAPGQLKHRARPGDDYQAIARTVCGTSNARIVATLRKWNGGPGRALKTGDVVYCPAELARQSDVVER